MTEAAALTDPSAILLGLAALAGLLAARSWFKVFASVNTGGEVVTGPSKRDLKDAAMLSAVAIGLASVGYLLGIFLPLP